jgi:hypothetical protein
MTDERQLRTSEEVLSQVRRDGLARRRQFLAGATAAAAVIVGALVVTTDSSKPDRDTVTVDNPSPTTPRPSVTVPTTEARPSDTTTSSVTEPSSTSAPAVACRNSTAAACGPMTWQPSVVNQPGTVGVTLVSISDDGTGEVSVKLTFSDPDSGPPLCSWIFRNAGHPTDQESADRQRDCQGPGVVQPCTGSFGPWTTPAPEPSASPPGGYQPTFNLPPGSHTVEFGMYFDGNETTSSDGTNACSPYAEVLTTTLEIVVPPA